MNANHVTLQEAIEIVTRLDAKDRLKLRHALDRMTELPVGEDAEMRFKRLLLDKGMITEIRAPRRGGCESRGAVPVKGSPVSETLIKDRG